MIENLATQKKNQRYTPAGQNIIAQEQNLGTISSEFEEEDKTN